MMTSADIRNQFLEFFKSKQHQLVPSAPIVIKNDPTLMFTNAGMNQFKDYFLGNKPAPFQRIADTQKCLRVSGKHNDLEEVGVDTYHHTMFEMLGNWSFGDYFKPEAIAWSWELLTEVLKIPKDQLYVTVFEGSEGEGISKDEEAIKEWKKWISEDRILLGNKKDNFWEMGDTGPCGPCTEIHVDTRTAEERKGVDGKTLVNSDNPQVIEIWNVVFIQYNRLKDGSLEPLPAKHVDTGMGFERLVRVLQQKSSNYDTDIFSGTINKVTEITGYSYSSGDSKGDVAVRVLADHIRAISFTIADGQLPSNTGAGYVIRRILRRAVRYYYSYLNYQQPLLFQLVPVIASQFENVFPELYQQQDFVTKVIREEEESFLRTLEKGLKRIEDIPKWYWQEKADIQYGDQYDLENSDKANWVHTQKNLFVERQLRENVPIKIPGIIAFELFDTYGFPLDLTRLIASEKGFTIDEEGFNAEMQQQKTRSRAASVIDAGDWIVLNENTAQNEFVGYNFLESDANILRYRKVKAKGKEVYQLVLDRTPFYAESGGQVGDTGELALLSSEGEKTTPKLRITDTKKENDLIIHFAENLPAELIEKVEVVATVDKEKRQHTAVHHTATHLLHAALRKVLGKQVAQKGSLVNSDYLRFDFSHFSKMIGDEIAAVETLVNEKIRENIPVQINHLPKEEALQSGAMALFGEKYGDTVRVVTIDPLYSVELCGGTHVGSTGELGFFKITSESAVAAGVRRIEAVSGWAAEQFINQQLQQLAAVREVLKNPADLPKAIASINEEAVTLKKQIEKYEQAQLTAIRDALLQKIESVNDTQFIGQVVEVPNADALKKLAFDLKAQLSNFVIVLTANIEGKAGVVIVIDEAVSVQKNLDASKIIKQQIAPLIKGGGGGQKTLATAGGQNAASLHQVIETVRNLI